LQPFCFFLFVFLKVSFLGFSKTSCFAVSAYCSFILKASSLSQCLL